jgi:hypothetical protein
LALSKSVLSWEHNTCVWSATNWANVNDMTECALVRLTDL